MMKDGEKTMGRGFELLELVGRSRNGLKGREIAGMLEIPVSTAFRQLKFLVERGYLRSGGDCDMDWVLTHTAVLHFCGKSKPWKPGYRRRFGPLYKHYMRLTELALPD